jgi:hypothetical protein
MESPEREMNFLGGQIEHTHSDSDSSSPLNTKTRTTKLFTIKAPAFGTRGPSEIKPCPSGALVSRLPHATAALFRLGLEEKPNLAAAQKGAQFAF